MTPNKLLVATNTGGIFRKSKQITQCLAEHPEGLNPKSIALYTSLNVNTIKSILPKMGNVRKSIRGIYLVVNGGDAPPKTPSSELSLWTFHNCLLSCRLTYHPKSYVSSTHSLGLINAEFIISSIGTATFRIACDTPLNVSSICMAYAFFRELIFQHSSDPVTPKEVYIKTIEFNKDHSNLRLDNARCITIENLCAQFKIYQKKLCLRVEHKTKVPFSVDTLTDMLTSNPNTLDMEAKINDLTKQVNSLIYNQFQTNKLLNQLLEAKKNGNKT